MGRISEQVDNILLAWLPEGVKDCIDRLKAQGIDDAGVMAAVRQAVLAAGGRIDGPTVQAAAVYLGRKELEADLLKQGYFVPR